MKVLLVDDSAPDRSILRYIFQAQGYETIEAENGRTALALAAGHKPDLIVSDALMPIMDGFAFLRAIKADIVLRDIPFIFYSAVYTGQNEEALARSLGAEAFLVKPLEPETLWQEVQELLSRHVAEKADSMPITQSEEEHFLREYNQVVVAKLEEKVKELEKLLIRVVSKTPGARLHSSK